MISDVQAWTWERINELYLVTNRSALRTALESVIKSQFTTWTQKTAKRERERGKKKTETKKKKGNTDEREIRKLQQRKQMSA